MAAIDSNLYSDLISIVGEKGVLTRPGDLLMYSFDSALDRGMPAAVVLPETPDQVTRVVKALAARKKPNVARGAATSLCGGPVPFQGAVVIGLARLKGIGKLDPQKREIVVEPGVVNLRLQEAISSAGLFFPPDPGSQKACTIGGNVATNAGGPHCLKYGVTSHFVAGLDVVLPDGKPVSLKAEDPGYDLVGFFVGSEGTLGIATRIRLKLLPKPAHVRTMLVSFKSIEEAIQSVTDIIAAGILPATLEAMDKTTVAAVEAFIHAGYPLDAEAVLLIEVDGDKPDQLDSDVEKIREVCAKNQSSEFRFAKDEAERTKLWEGRRGSYPAMARLAPNVLVEDGAVPRTMLPQALKRVKAIAEEAGLRVALLFHAGDGNLHPQIIFDERDKEQTKKVKEAGYKMLKACVELGGTISGEHGIGTDKREAMKWLFTRETLTLFRRLKNAFDPDNLCNPDKLIPLISNTAAPPLLPAAPTPPGTPSNVAPAPDGTTSPATTEEAVALVRRWALEKTPFGVQGSRSRCGVREPVILGTTNLNKVLDFDRGNLTLTVESGARLADLRAEVEKTGQYLWVAGEGTVGGAVATRSSLLPPLRDLILGMRVLLATGEEVRFGAKTMKNVAGYDAAKLLIGSWGTLGVILDVTFRLFPYPAKELRSGTVAPFVLNELHKKIKHAFDPAEILMRRLSNATAADLAAPPKEKEEPKISEKEFRSLEEKFWM